MAETHTGTHRKWSLLSVIGVLLTVMGLIFSAVTIIHVATYNPEKVSSLKVASSPDSTFIYTAAGVVNLMGEKPHVTITSPDPDATVQWGYGASRDIQAYVGNSAAQEITGYSADGTDAAVTSHAANADNAQADKDAVANGGFALDSSDNWITSGSGLGSVEFDLTVDSTVNRSLIATTDKGIAPEVTISWVYVVQTASPAPFVVMGVLVVLIGVVLLLTDWREQTKRANIAKKQQMKRAQASADTQVLPVFTGDLANPQLDRAIQHTHTDGAFGAGILPGTHRTKALRERELSDDGRIIIPVDDEDPHHELTKESDSVDEHGAGETLWSYTEPFEEDDDVEVDTMDLPEEWRGKHHA